MEDLEAIIIGVIVAIVTAVLVGGTIVICGWKVLTLLEVI